MSKQKQKPKKATIDRSDLEAVLRKAIVDSGRAVNEIAVAADVPQSGLSRFMRSERTLTLPIASRLCKTLRLELIQPR